MFDEKQIKERMKNLYFDPKTKRFFTILEIDMVGDKQVYSCSGFCEYATDACTTIQRQNLSDKYIFDCERVICIDEYAIFDGIGFRVRE
jgi:hypothetical protein